MTLLDSTAVYPPEHHVLRDLAIDVQPGRTVNRAWMNVHEHLCNENGRVHTGLVATLVDAICGGLAAVTAQPGWIATADLTLHVAKPIEGDVVSAVARVRRSGRTTIVLEAEVFVNDDESSPVAVSTATFQVLERRQMNPTLVGDLSDDEPRRPFVEGAKRFLQPAYDACGFERLDDERVQVLTAPYILNSLGGIQGGILASLADAATVNALGHPFETVDLHLTYLSLAKVGPVVAAAVPRERRDDYGACSVELFDTGAGRVTTRAETIGVCW